MCFYQQPIVAIHTANCATRNIVELLYRRELRRKQYCFKVGNTNYVEDVLKMDGASSSL